MDSKEWCWTHFVLTLDWKCGLVCTNLYCHVILGLKYIFIWHVLIAVLLHKVKDIFELSLYTFIKMKAKHISMFSFECFDQMIFL